MLIHSRFHTLPVNVTGRDFVVGDVHGHSALLDALLPAVAFDPAVDRLIALGDLIDRGPDSRGLLERVREVPWFYSLRGNHEEWLQDSLDDWGAERSWRKNGGTWADGLPRSEVRSLAEIVNGMPFAMALPLRNGETIGLIHAELSTWNDWEALATLDTAAASQEDQKRVRVLMTEALWGRRRFSDWQVASYSTNLAELDAVDRRRVRRSLMQVPGVDLLIAGHTIIADRQLVQVANLLWIDTCTYDAEGALTMVEPLTRRYWQASYREGLSGNVVTTDCGVLPPPSELPTEIRDA